SRAREIAVRKALGATRARLVGQLLVESLVLAAAGGALGLGLAQLGVPVVQRLGAGTLPRLEDARVGGALVGFALALCGLTAVVFGSVPALHASRDELVDVLRQGGRGASDGSARRHLRLLFVAEAAVAVVLLAGAGLLVRSLASLRGVDPGFDPRGV